jgi:hypothetical protein
MRRALLLAGALAACNSSDGGSRSAPTPTPQPPGGCKDVAFKGNCSLSGVVPSEPGTDGMVSFEIQYTTDGPPPLGTSSLVVHARADEREQIEAHYEKHSPVACAGTIIQPPCPPGAALQLELPPPPVGTTR